MNPTKVYLLSVPLDKDYSDTLYFASAAAQKDYFITKVKRPFDYFTYQRKDGTIRIPAHIDSLHAAGCNYVMYQNPDYNNKWFYAFITNMEYKSDEVTIITIKTDCIQTWMFDIDIKSSFVEREHPASDEIGEHTLDEGLELGEYMSNKHTKSGYASEDLSIVIGVTKLPTGEKAPGKIYNNLYSGVQYYAFGTKDATEISTFLAKYDEDGAADAVTCMFLAPEPLANATGGLVMPSGWINEYYINSPDETVPGTQIEFSSGLLDGYSPRNKKLLSFPYRYLLVANNSGASVPMKYERFRFADKSIMPPRFVIEGAICPGCSVRLVPLNYNGAPRNDEEAVNMGKFPALNWNSDVYTNWLTQNGVNIAVSLATGVGQIAGGVAAAVGTGGVGTVVGAGLASGGVSTIASTLAQIHQQSYSPPQAKGNLNSGDIVTASDQNDFHFYDMSIKAEYAKIIDDYFTMFGYKCHRVKVPEKAHRGSYWYTKTIDVNITGAIPQEDLQTIKDCYNRGITFWRHTAEFKSYTTQGNAII